MDMFKCCFSTKSKDTKMSQKPPMLQIEKPIQKPKEVETRIFLLTDGQAHDRKYVEEQVKKVKQNQKIFTFGLGAGVDKKFLKEVAQDGKGTCSIVSDRDN